MATAILALALGSGALLALLLGVATVRRDFEFWPPPERESWQFHVAFGLFRVFCGATCVFALLDWGSLGWDHWSRLAVGLPVLLIGAYVTVRGYLWLGLNNTYCEADGLVTGGLYAYSRNPQYVASVAATIGLAITANSWITLGLAAALFGIYALFALNEEPWLREGYGEAYDAYASETPRFIDERSLIRAGDRFIKGL